MFKGEVRSLQGDTEVTGEGGWKRDTRAFGYDYVGHVFFQKSGFVRAYFCTAIQVVEVRGCMQDPDNGGPQACLQLQAFVTVH